MSLPALLPGNKTKTRTKNPNHTHTHTHTKEIKSMKASIEKTHSSTTALIEFKICMTNPVIFLQIISRERKTSMRTNYLFQNSVR